MHAATHVENNNELRSGKTFFRWKLLLIYYILACKSKIAFMVLDFETDSADKPRMNAELKIMMAELKSTWIKLKIMPRDIFIPANRHEDSHVNEK